MADQNPSEWGAIEASLAPSSWGAIPVEESRSAQTAEPKQRNIRRLESFMQLPERDAVQAIRNFKAAKVGEEFDIPSSMMSGSNARKAIKLSDKTFDDSNEKIGAIPAALGAAALRAPESAGFLGAMGAASAALPAGSGAVVRTLAPIAAGLVTSLGVGAARHALQPKELTEFEAKAMADQPIATTVGGMTTSGFQPGSLTEGGLKAQVLSRLAPAALGAGLATTGEAIGGFDEGSAGRIGLAALENAILKDTTKAGAAVSGFGHGAVSALKKPSIVSQVDAATSGTPNRAQSEAAAAKLATGAPEEFSLKEGMDFGGEMADVPFSKEEKLALANRNLEVNPATGAIEPAKRGILTGEKTIKAPKADLGEFELKAPMEFAEGSLDENLRKATKTKKATSLQKQIEKELGIGEPQKSAIESAGELEKVATKEEIDAEIARRKEVKSAIQIADEVTRPSVDAPGKTVLSDLVRAAPPENPKLKGLVGQNVEYAGNRGQLAVNSEGEFVVIPHAREKGSPVREVVIEGVGKDGNVRAGDVGVKPETKLQAGFINPTVMAHAASPGIGAVIGYQFGDTDEEKRQNAVLGALILGGGSLASHAAISLKRRAPEAFKAIQEKMATKTLPEGEMAVKGKETAPAGLPEAPAIFLGNQDLGNGQSEPLYNLTKAIPGHPKGSTVSKTTLESKGFKVPEVRSPDSIPTSERGSVLIPGEDPARPGGKVGATEEAVAQLDNQEAKESVLGRMFRGGMAEARRAMEARENPPHPLNKKSFEDWFLGTSGGQALEEALGTAQGNIRSRSRKVSGMADEYDAFVINLKKKWADQIAPLTSKVREAMTPEEFSAFDNAMWHNDFDTARQLLASKDPSGGLVHDFDAATPVFKEMAATAEGVGREIHPRDNFWAREVADFDGLMKELRARHSQEEMQGFDDLFRAEEKRLKRELSDAEKGKIVADAIMEKADEINTRATVRIKGKPSFLKARTIQELDPASIKKFYQDYDYAAMSRIDKMADDVGKRVFFGHDVPENIQSWSGRGGNFGKAIAEEIAAGNLTEEKAKRVEDALKAVFMARGGKLTGTERFGNAVGRTTNALMLGQISSFANQFADVFGIANLWGTKSTIKATAEKKVFDLGDVLGDNPFSKMMDLDKSPNASKLSKLQSLIVENIVGTSDRFMKNKAINAIFYAAEDAIKNPESREFLRMDRRYRSQLGSERWEEILKDISSDAFLKDHKLNENTRAFMVMELKRLQPITGFQRAEFEAAHPIARNLYTLKRFWIRQLDILREEGYERIRDARRTGNQEELMRGAGKLASWLFFVGAGQGLVQGTFSDLIKGRETDPAENAMQGITNLGGVSRYSLEKMSRGDLSGMFTPPILGPIQEAIKEYHDPKGRLLKYVPVVGAPLYYNVGAGAEDNEKAAKREESRRRRVLQTGEGELSPTLDALERALTPANRQDKKR